MLTPWRRGAAAALCLLLSACAAGRSGADGTALNDDRGYGAYLAARYAATQNDDISATHYYALALQANPNDPALVGAGFEEGLLSGSPETVALAARLPNNPLAMMLLGNEAVRKGDYATATQIFSSLPSDDISGLVKPLLLAWVQLGQNNEEAALNGLVGPNSTGVFSGVDTLNAALIADAAHDTPQASALYAQVNNAQPNLRLAQIEASWLARQGQTDQAQAELNGLAQAHPDLRFALPALQAQIAQPVINTPAQGLAEAYLTLAGSLNAAQNAPLRVVFLRFALGLRPDLSAARLLLSSAQIGADDPTYTASPVQMRNALATLTQVAQTDPLYAPAAMQEAQLLGQLGQTDAAVAALNTLLVTAPNDPGLLAATGDALRNANRYADALPYYNKALVQVGTPIPPEAWSLVFDRGICEDQSGNWAEAEPDLTTALALAPDQPYVQNYLAYSWALRGEKLPQAHALLVQAAALTPNDGDIIDSLAYVELRQGKVKSALARSLQAVHLEPDDPEINGHLGDAFYANHQPLEADYQWQRALALKPDAKLKAELDAKIAQHFGAPAP